MSKYRNTKKQGDAGLGSAIAYFTAMGVTVCIPLTDSDDYDLVVDINGLKKVQAKMVEYRNKSGRFYVSLSVKGGNSKSNFVHKTANLVDYDILFILTSDNERYVIPKTEIANIRSAIVLGSKYERYKV